MHMAGCVGCGVMHLCQHDTCITSSNHEGHSICQITGLCTKMLNFSDMEFVNTTHGSLVHPKQPREKKLLRLTRKKRFKKITMNRASTLESRKKEVQNPGVLMDDMVNSFVREILCSDQWTHSNNVEYDRYASKWSSALTKVLRDFKRNNPGTLPIIPDMYSMTWSTMGNTRIPADTCIEDRQILATWCADNIRHHLMMLQGNFPDAIQPNRLQGMVVGLIYLMRCGIIVKGIVVLPRLQMLSNTLPLESHLPHLFGIKGKVITETENMVKQILKSLSSHELVVYGMPQNISPIHKLRG
jgi:hypothetical protein